MISSYAGTFFVLKSLLLHYFALSYPFSHITLMVGITALVVVGILWLFPRISRQFTLTIKILALLPLLVGIIGTALLNHSIHYTTGLEEAAGLESSGNRDSDLQYGYSPILLLLFPAAIGTAGSISYFLLLGIIGGKKRAGPGLK